MAEIGLAAAALAGMGLRALEEGDIARAVETLGSINEESWQALGERFPGFPTQLAGNRAHGAVEPGLAVAIESADR